MKLTLWTYEGPPHVGAMRVATGMKGLHYVLHAPQGDTYADLLFTMIERRNHRPPVTFTTFQASDLGADTATMFKQAAQAAYDRFRPQAMIVGASCTAELIQDDPGGLAATLGLPCPVVPLDATPADITRMWAAHFNVLLYPETGESAARWLESAHGQPWTKTVPIGVGATRDFIAEVAALAGVSPDVPETGLPLPWWSASVDSTYLTGKRVFLFGDATHVMAAARIARDEIGFDVVGMGCFNREYARPLRAMAKAYGVEALITDDYLEVEAAIAAAAPEMILGTQMERHIGKRLGIPCAVISAPVHVQDFPARYSPQMGFEGANVIFDTWIHPLVMGLEEHLLTMFREDFEFHDSAGASHHGGKAQPRPQATCVTPSDAITASTEMAGSVIDAALDLSEVIHWQPDAEKELKKIPFFVRGKAKRNTEKFASEKGVTAITIDTLYEAKAHYAR